MAEGRKGFSVCPQEKASVPREKQGVCSTVPGALGKDVGVAVPMSPSSSLPALHPLTASSKVLRTKGNVEFWNFHEVQEFVEEFTCMVRRH